MNIDASKSSLGAWEIIMIILEGTLIMGALGAQLYYVPRFIPLFEEQGVRLPRLTEIVIHTSGWWLIPITIFWMLAFGLITLARFRLKNTIKLVWLRFAFLVAILGYIILIVVSMFLPMWCMIESLHNSM
jgi:type II secretory pathway component PulF